MRMKNLILCILVGLIGCGIVLLLLSFILSKIYETKTISDFLSDTIVIAVSIYMGLGFGALLWKHEKHIDNKKIK